ncbi:MAG: methylmalonyl-CoA mutase family protein, partial [Candidatus Neomarinimicrobiota bacterium]|nr:methylmalonyl-CoA mutase family protein [Candidatus Neomarinimicrobiota bacterium]
IAHESGITNFVDPLAGSEVIEELTDQLEMETQAIIDEVDNLGGSIEAIEKGWIQNQIAESAYIYQQKIDNKKQKIVGVNSFIEKEEEKKIENLQKIDEKLISDQIKKVHELKKNRDNNDVKSKLSKLNDTANSNDNLMPHIINAVRSQCTIGEIADSLRKCFGEFDQR